MSRQEHLVGIWLGRGFGCTPGPLSERVLEVTDSPGAGGAAGLG